jgi:hypothetical protein
MKKVSGCGLQVSGSASRWLLVLMLLAVSTFASPGFGYEMKYKFQKGQILKYQYDTQILDGRSSGNDHSIFEFRVDSLSPTGAFITMIPKQHAVDKNDYTRADIGKRISFHIAEDGLIGQFQGVHELFYEIIAGFQKKESIGNKLNVSYHWLQLRYWDDYYKMLIGYFFPPLPRTRYDKTREVIFNLSRESIRVNQSWGGSYPDAATTELPFQKHILLFLDEKIQWEDSTEFQKFTVVDRGPGVATWDPAKSIFTDLTFKGANVSQLLTVWVNGDLSMPNGFRKLNVALQQNKIELLSSSTDTDVMLNFTLFSVDSTQLDILSPREMINPIIWATEIPKAGRDTAIFGYRIVIDQAGLFYTKLRRMGEKFNYEFSSKDNILFYAQPGDSMDIRIDMEHPDSILFIGEHAKENQFLQRFFHYDVQRQINRLFNGESFIADGVRNDRKLLEKNKVGLDPEFVKRLEFELDYTEKEAELNFLFVQRIDHDSDNLMSVVRKYRQYLGQLKYHESVAYQKFLSAFVRVSQWNAGLWGGMMNTRSNYLSAGLFLQGWDRYWMLAKMAHDGLKWRLDLDYEWNYLSFIDEYGETPFGGELQVMYKSTRITDDPELPARLDIDRFSGHPVIVSFDYESTKSFYSKFFKQIKNIGKSDFRIVQYVPKEDFQKVLSELVVYADKSWENIDKVSSQIHPRDFTDSIAKLKESFNSMLLLFDRDGKFVCYLQGDLISEIQLKNILFWPSLERPVVKKIDLTIFWYSLGGAFVLAIVIILVIRIRSKRKEARMNLKRKIAQLEVDAVRSRMNPHFLFNALGSIQNLVNKGKNLEASQYLARFGDLVRTILTQSSKPVIGLNEEIDMIRNYLLLEQLGFPFEFNIDVDPALDPATIEIPPLLIQPHVENAVIHGISSLGAVGKIGINFREADQHLICEVTDNGPGYHPGSNPEKEGLGQGWKLTRQRIQLMKEQYGEDVSVEVSNGNSNSDGISGNSETKVTFRLPLQNSLV